MVLGIFFYLSQIAINKSVKVFWTLALEDFKLFLVNKNEVFCFILLFIQLLIQIYIIIYKYNDKNNMVTALDSISSKVILIFLTKVIIFYIKLTIIYV